MNPNRRKVLVTAAAAATTQAVFAQPALTAAAPKFYEKGGVRIRYTEVGSGFPLLCIPGGGLNSQISSWPSYPINVMETFKDDFRCITLDQRNAIGGGSTGPVQVDGPWEAFADDQLGLMDHLSIHRFMFFGNCIGGSFGMKLMERAPDRVVAGVLSQPIGHRPEAPDYMYTTGRDGWGAALRKQRPDLSAETIDMYLHNLYRAQPDFLYSVSRAFVAACQTPILVLPDDTAAHAYQASVDIASLAPNAEVTVYPWIKPPELKVRTVERVRTFLKAHRPMTA